MQLSVLLMLALPALSSAGSCEEDEPVKWLHPSLEERVPKVSLYGPANQTHLVVSKNFNPSFSVNFDHTNLKWQTFDGSLPKGVISIYNGYEERTDYVCQFWCNTGFYNPEMGSPHYCRYPWGGVEYAGEPFQILVNKDNFELMEWKEGSDGSVPQNSVKIQYNKEIYVGKNQYGLGKVDVKQHAFFLPWKGSDYLYRNYHVLTISKDVYSEHICEVNYNTDGVRPIDYPPETMDTSDITNKDCRAVTGTATLSKTYQVEKRWDTSFSITGGVKASITAGIPIIGSTDIEISVETTLQFTSGTTYIESITHTMSIEHIVPPNHSCRVTMVGYQYGADIPYTARVSRTYSNGKTRWTSISGTYKGVQMGEVRGVVDHCEPLAHPTICD